MAYTQFYVKLTTLISGTTPAYFSSCAEGLTGAPANEYKGVLDVRNLSRADQRLEQLEGTNTFPSIFFDVIDPKKTGTASDITTISELLANNSNYVYKTRVEFYEGNSETTYSSFTKTFTGYIEERTRGSGRWTFECSSLFKRGENPVNFPTGSAVVDTAFNYNATGNGSGNLVILKDAINLTNARSYIFQNDGTTTTWPNGSDSGTITFNTPSGGMTGNGASVNTTHTEISVGSGAANVKFGVCYTFYAKIRGIGVGSLDNDATTPSSLQLTIEGRDASGNIIDAVVGPKQNQSAKLTGGARYTGVMYLLKDPRVNKVRLTLTIDDTLGNTGVAEGISFGTSNAWMIGREVVDILTSDTASGRVTLAARGGLGSIASAHVADEECLKITPIGGHPLDILRRVCLSTHTAGTNGSYDPGDGFGLGNEFSSSDFSSNFDTVRNTIITGTLYPAYSGATTYKYGDIVSYSSKNWIAIYTATAGFSAQTPAEGAYWTETANPFNGENFKNYKMLFFVPQKIENIWEFISSEILKPIHANLYQDETGKLNVRVWSSAAVVGAGALTDDHRKFDGEIKITNTRALSANAVIYRMDFDQIGTLDSKGGQNGMSSAFAREFVFDEASYGDTNYTKQTQYGYREFVIESRGARGSHSARFGWCYNMDGDQMAYEVGRRIITRFGGAIDEYEWNATWSKRTLSTGDIVSVTHPNMLNTTTGVWGRSAEAMVVVSKSTDYETGDSLMILRCEQDISAIPNVAGDAGATANTNVPTVSGGGSILSSGYPQALTTDLYESLPVYPKNYARIIFIKLTGVQSNDLMVYAYSADSSTTPTLEKYQHVGDILAGETVFYFLVIAATSGTISYFVKLRDRNSDRVYGAFSATIGPNTSGNAYNYGAHRGPKAEIMQLNSQGVFGVYQLGLGGGFTSYGR